MEQTIEVTQFENEIIDGLQAPGKSISSRFFYDDEGSQIFRKIMHMPEYYLTRVEYEIIEKYAADIYEMLHDWQKESFDLVELGAGDGFKTSLLIRAILARKAKFTYVPVDISEKAISILENKIKLEFPEVTISSQIGDYFNVLQDLDYCKKCPRLVLFLGSNIGNYTHEESLDFFRKLAETLKPGDMVLTGFDLKKDPEIIRSAYDDPHGFTRDFNLNLLKRINRELKADFDTSSFRHVATYNPQTGIAKSFLVSEKEQTVHIGARTSTIHFDQWEAIQTEMSRKYLVSDIEKLANQTGFEVLKNYCDHQNFFTDSLWKKIHIS